MSKLNTKGKNVTTNIRTVAARRGEQLGVSANGNLQFKKEPLQMLYELTVSTLFGKSTFYKTSDQLVQELRKHVATAVKNDNMDFVANLAIHARTEMNIRTMPLVLVVEFANELRKQNKLYQHTRQLVCDVIQRADQITDMYAYALEVFGSKNKVPMAIKRGVADAFNKFGEYNFAKYNRDGAVKFRDVLRIVHPEAKDARQGMIFEKIMKETLEAPYTWEVELSKNGQLPEAERKTKSALWTELVMSGKVGYMALLRNMRNIVEAGVGSSTVRHLANVLSDPANVLKSKQLPFDFVEAYKIVKPLNGTLATAVSQAIDVSVGNLPELGKKLWVIIDYSGSMGSDDGVPINTATLLASSLLKAAGRTAEDIAVTLFGSAAKTLKGVDVNNSVLGIQRELLTHRRGNIAGSTDFDAALREYNSLGFVPDTIVVFTDGEVNRFPYAHVRAIGNKAVKLTVNLAAASTTPMSPCDGWFAVAGWSSAMFKWIPAIRNKETVVEQLAVEYIGLPRKTVTEYADGQ
jgi:60 kDa SS-A/Ro ribonucleoprotein